MSTKKFKTGDKVKRAFQSGCMGTVTEVKSDITATSSEAKEKGLMFNVNWDNGTVSCLSAEGLELVSQ